MDPEDPKAGRSDPMREGRGNRERLHGSNPQVPELHAALKRQPQKEGFRHREPTEPHSSRMRHAFPAFLHTPHAPHEQSDGPKPMGAFTEKGAGIPHLETFPRKPDAPLHRRFVQNACRQVRFRERDRRFQVRYRHTSIREGCPRIEPRLRARAARCAPCAGARYEGVIREHRIHRPAGYRRRLRAQYGQLIARRVRDLHVYSEIVPCDIAAEEVRALAPAAIILSGGPASVYAEDAPSLDPEIFELGIPVLGFCYGQQIMAVTLAARWGTRRRASTAPRRSRASTAATARPRPCCTAARRPSRPCG